MKKKVYIAGPITGVNNYSAPFEKAEKAIAAKGWVPLNPARLPQGMENKDYATLCLAMLEVADAVLFLSDWERSVGALLEMNYCAYTKKLIVYDIDILEAYL